VRTAETQTSPTASCSMSDTTGDSSTSAEDRDTSQMQMPVDAQEAVSEGTFVISRVQIGYLQYQVYYIIVFAKVHVF